MSVAIRPEEMPVWSHYIQEICGIHLDNSQGYLLETRLSGLLSEASAASFSELFYKVKADTTVTLRARIIDAITTPSFAIPRLLICSGKSSSPSSSTGATGTAAGYRSASGALRVRPARKSIARPSFSRNCLATSIAMTFASLAPTSQIKWWPRQATGSTAAWSWSGECPMRPSTGTLLNQENAGEFAMRSVPWLPSAPRICWNHFRFPRRLTSSSAAT